MSNNPYRLIVERVLQQVDACVLRAYLSRHIQRLPPEGGGAVVRLIRDVVKKTLGLEISALTLDDLPTEVLVEFEQTLFPHLEILLLSKETVRLPLLCTEEEFDASLERLMKYVAEGGDGLLQFHTARGLGWLKRDHITFVWLVLPEGKFFNPRKHEEGQ